MSVAATVAPASPLAAIFERYHVGWVTRDPDLIARLKQLKTISTEGGADDPLLVSQVRSRPYPWRIVNVRLDYVNVMPKQR